MTNPDTITMRLCGSSWRAAHAPALPGFAPSRVPLFLPVVWR
ncbi:hypothetical protein [Streptomyces mirabilis]|jgi:hypothetical protein|uniref:Uncharacterized protein n=1 Tax=Streptomyces mirabilis TaxID=68239 RepID=A0A1I2U8X8_9ACTN|nr:hypothetical protein [Streptomyces mirabilis]SFG71051.1 hypothetical protein SAMN02787118_126120 [Streptomyces mirabilis]